MASDDKERDFLHFEQNRWTQKDINVFFEDLRFGNPVVYDKCVRKFPHLHQKTQNGLLQAERRYKTWCQLVKDA